MRELNNPPQIGSDIQVSLVDTRILGCKPSQAKKSDEWFVGSREPSGSSIITTQNADSLSDLEISKETMFRVETEEELSTSAFCNQELKVKIEVQRDELVGNFEREMAEKMEEMDRAISKRWEEAILKVHEKYQQKIEKHEENLNEYRKKGEANGHKNREQLEQEINQKYYQQYLEKIESINETVQKLEQDKMVDIIYEVKKEMEVLYEKKNESRLEILRREIQEDLESMRVEEELYKISEAEAVALIEMKLKPSYEEAINEVTTEKQKELEALKRRLRELEQGQGIDRIKGEIKEKLKHKYILQENERNREWKEKMEEYKMEVHEAMEREKLRRMEHEMLELAKEKEGIGLSCEVLVLIREGMMNRTTSKVRKTEELNKELEKRLEEQKERYTTIIEGLKHELEELKKNQNGTRRERSSVRNTSMEGESWKQTYKRSNSSEKLRQSWCAGSNMSDVLSQTRTLESASKASTIKSRREGSNEPRRTSMEKEKSKENVRMTSEARRSLSKTLKKQSIPVRQTALTQPFNFERATKAILQMLSPTTPSDMQHLESDPRYETMQGPSSEATAISNYVTEDTKERKEFETSEKLNSVEVTPQRPVHQRRNSLQLGERDRVISSAEKEGKTAGDMLRQRNFNINLRKASIGERNLEWTMGEAEKGRNNKPYVAKYEELLRRQGSGCKKRESSITQRKENSMTSQTKRSQLLGNQENMQIDKKSVAKMGYKKYFEIKPEDDEMAKAMKKLKKSIEEKLKENEQVASKCHSKEVDLCINLPVKPSLGLNPSDQEILRDKLKTLFGLWKTADTSNFERIVFMESLDALFDSEEITKKVEEEIVQMTHLMNRTEAVMKLLMWRSQLREQIKPDNFSYNLYEKVYQALESNSKELKKVLESYQKTYAGSIQYKGIDLENVIKVDCWESEYLRNMGLKNDMVQKNKKKI